ncbi:MAG: LamG-like jellyroll fold domain-containing protein [bacterium]|nr:LamG-like jellyroll fold domain-containing protein [bacterium]
MKILNNMKSVAQLTFTFFVVVIATVIVFSATKPAVSQAEELNLKATTPIQGFQVETLRSNKVKLDWKKYEGVNKYRIAVINAESGKRKKVLYTNRTKKTVKRLKHDTDYEFKLRAKAKSKKNIKANALTSHTKVSFTPEAFTVEDDYNGSTLGAVYPTADIAFVDGHEGQGMIHVYSPTDDGGELRANALGYEINDGDLMDSRSGTIELWVNPASDVIENSNTHGLMSAWTHNGINRWGITVYQNQLIVYRDFAPCIRSINRIDYTFETGQWYKLTMSWRGPLTTFYINNEEVGTFENESRNIYKTGGSYDHADDGTLKVGDDLFVSDNLRVSKESTLPVQKINYDEIDNIECPNFVGMLDENIDEEYENIKLHNFPSQETRNVIKGYIDDLPNSYFDNGSATQDIQHIVLVDDSQYEVGQRTGDNTGSIANFAFYGRAMYLKESYFDTVAELEDQQKNFFHEAGHAHIYSQGLNYSGPFSGSTRTEWGKISGLSTYAGECTNPDTFILEDGFLTAHGSTMPDEDLAEWAGIVMDMYQKDSTFAVYLNPAKPKYSNKFQQKIDFLLEKKFITQKIYDAVTRNQNNVTDYTMFNG